MKAKFKCLLFLAFLLATFGIHNGQAQIIYTDNVTVKRAGASLFIINESQSAWSRAGLVLNNPYQAISTNFEILYEKNGTGSTGTSSGIFRKNNSSGFLNYMQFNEANNSIYLFPNKSGSQFYGSLFLSNGNFLIGANGKVGIGTNSPTEKLEVNGTIRAKEVRLEATNWPDYVFEEGYELMPLDVVKAHIEQKGHLPGLKSAKEYQEQGVNMLDLNQQLLEKIEELTLYSIVQENKINSHEKNFQSQNRKLELLRSNMKDLLVEMENLKQLILEK